MTSILRHILHFLKHIPIGKIIMLEIHVPLRRNFTRYDGKAPPYKVLTSQFWRIIHFPLSLPYVAYTHH